jgi:hypothetical protein
LFERFAEGSAGVVDQDVHPAPDRQECLQGALDGGGVGGFAEESQGLATQLGNLHHGSFDDGLVGAEDEHLGSGLGEGSGNGRGKAVSLSGQEGDLAIQTVLRVDGHCYLLEN